MLQENKECSQDSTNHKIIQVKFNKAWDSKTQHLLILLKPQWIDLSCILSIIIFNLFPPTPFANASAGILIPILPLSTETSSFSHYVSDNVLYIYVFSSLMIFWNLYQFDVSFIVSKNIWFIDRIYSVNHLFNQMALWWLYMQLLQLL